MSPASMATALSLTSAAVWGASDFVGGVAAQRIRASAVVAISHSLSLGLLILAALAARASWPGRASVVYGLIAGAACGAGVILLYKALALGSMGITASISGVLAALLPVIFALLTEGAPKPRQWLGFLLAGAAIWLIAAAPSPPGGSPSNARGVLLGAAAGLSFGVLFIFLKLAGRGGVLWPLACSRMASASLAIVIVLWRGRGNGGAASHAPTVAPGPAPEVESRSGKTMAKGMSWGVLGLASIAGTFDATGNTAYTMATRAGRLDIAAVLASLYPASTILLAAWLLKERTTRTQTFGMALALAAVVMITV